MESVNHISIAVIHFLGLSGVILWVALIFLREMPIVHHPSANIWLGIAPNFGVALLLPMLLANYYPVVFKRRFTRQIFLDGLAVIFTVLLLSEVVHDIFLNSGFDIWDLAASLVALVIMVLFARKRNSMKKENNNA
jgi:hypothetical protein